MADTNAALFYYERNIFFRSTGCSLGIRDWRILQQLRQNSLSKLTWPGALYLIFLIRCVAHFPGTFSFSPATEILNENPIFRSKSSVKKAKLRQRGKKCFESVFKSCFCKTKHDSITGFMCGLSAKHLFL